ncbi:MAG: hypothetical protein J5712_01090 [Lachnospiraceae bacterium]|nr:hypothetical protein [Lachnospiraceae bacterium]MBO4558652.1 hypothetical protein [Lachnospiraceae bacterium]MBR5733782.1 hypothetical protein [Lachnospiraceae bacterium]
MKKLSKGAIWGIVIAAVAVVVTIVLIVAEQAAGGHIYIENNSDKEIKRFDVSFYDEYSETLAEYLFSDAIPAGANLKLDYGEALNFSGMDAVCVMKVLVEGGEEVVIYEGSFTGKFDGNFSFKFSNDEDDYYLKAKAYAGLFGSTKGSNLDDEYVLWFDIGDYDYADGYYEDFDEEDDEY